MPVKLDEIISKALQKDRYLRYQHASEIRSDLQQLQNVVKSVLETPADSKSIATPPGKPAVSRKNALKLVLPVGVIVLALLGAIIFGMSHRRASQASKLTEKDAVVLADFANSTGDPVFDNTLKQALSISLRQSPFLNILSDGRVRATLAMMTKQPNIQITNDVAREICQRTQSKPFIGGSISALGQKALREGPTEKEKRESASHKTACSLKKLLGGGVFGFLNRLWRHLLCLNRSKTLLR